MASTTVANTACRLAAPVRKSQKNVGQRMFSSNSHKLMARKAIMKPQRQVAAHAQVGLFFSTTTGNTEEVADEIKAALGDAVTDPSDIGDVEVASLTDFDGLIVGTPTWNTGADESRSGTAWDDVLDELRGLDMSGKKVALFGCGDSSSYSDYFCDAMEEIYSIFSEAGADMVGHFSVADNGYEFDSSKSVVGEPASSDDATDMLGLAIDVENQSDMSEDRIAAWTEKVKGEMGL